MTGVQRDPCLLAQALQTRSGGASLAARLELLSKAVTQLMMDHVSQALFNADQLAHGMHMARSLAPHLLQPQGWDIFLGNAVGEPTVSHDAKSAVSGHQLSSSALSSSSWHVERKQTHRNHDGQN